MDSIPSMADPPFACPPDIVLDLPVPPSVNLVRKINPVGLRALKAWKNTANAYVLAAKGRTSSPLRLRKLERFEVFVILSEHHTRIDLDNSLKALIDYLKHIEIIVDDGPKYMRKLTVEWGVASMGCRVVVRPIA